MKIYRAVAINLILLVTSVAILVYDFRSELYHNPMVIMEDKIFQIQTGDTLGDILGDLYAEDAFAAYSSVVPLHWYVLLYMRLSEQSPSGIQAGEYLLRPGMRLHQFLDKAYAGQVIQRKFAIIEGHTLRQTLDAMAALPSLELTTTDYAAISQHLGIAPASPEGWIFPDTYYYLAGSDALELLAQAHQKMQAVLAEAWQNKDPRVALETPYQALILASIVEKEASKIDERPQVAGVFLNRLAQNMRLQADPTIIYGLGSRFSGDLKSRHLKEDQPYNTYTRGGLPPTPIATPSLSAIAAVMQPQFGDYLYFVAKGDGSHYFSKTYQEHAQAVKKYQLGQ